MYGIERARHGTDVAALVVLVLTLVAACAGVGGSTPSTSPSTPPSPAGGPRGIVGRATAGPVCPVERVPPDPSCAARPVAGAVIVVRDAAGAEAGRTTTDADGHYFLALGPGRYTVVAQPMAGLMGTPQPQDVTVEAVAQVDLVYDTGIR